MKVLVLDNYDSFTYNLVHFLGKSNAAVSVDVYRNDQISLNDVNYYQKIVLSPGPGLPSEAGIMLDLIKAYSSTKSILGICLGHQAIAEVFGGSLKNLKEVVHGVSTPIKHITSDYLFANMPNTMNVGRYHSWVVEELPNCLTPIAIDMEQQIMAIRHNQLDVRGIQFHPESILTENGQQLINNWINHSL